MRQRFLLLHNPVAGLRRHRLVRRVVRELEERGAEVVMLRLWGLGQNLPQQALANIVHFDRFDAVIAAGGDGTVRALAKALGADTRAPVGVIPAGTGNVLARELPLPSTPHEVAEMLLNGPVVEIPGVRANDEPFFLMAGIGFDGEVINGLDMELKRRIGKIAYVWPLLKALTRKPRSFDILVDGERYRASWAVVAKSSRYAGGFIIAPDVCVTNEHLVAVLFQATSRLGRLVELIALGIGQQHRLPGVAAVPCKRIQTSEPGLAVQIDGDEAGTTPVVVELGGDSLRMIVPTDFGMSGQKFS
ncbi:MAG: diacylglycerol kinase [Alphaproteobacteria bacterium]|nr:diacylglycerol kinase [Alphaproteobacteria bacterium]